MSNEFRSISYNLDSFGHVVHLPELVKGGDGHVRVLVDVVGADIFEEGSGHPRGLILAEELLEDVQAGHLADELENWAGFKTLTT